MTVFVLALWTKKRTEIVVLISLWGKRNFRCFKHCCQLFWPLRRWKRSRQRIPRGNCCSWGGSEARAVRDPCRKGHSLGPLHAGSNAGNATKKESSESDRGCSGSRHGTWAHGAGQSPAGTRMPRTRGRGFNREGASTIHRAWKQRSSVLRMHPLFVCATCVCTRYVWQK